VASPARPDLRSYTGYLLRRAHVRAVGIERSCLGDDARLRATSALSILDELGPLSQRELCALTHISPTVMVRVVDGLEARGWVTRERKPDDRRSYALRLTPDGVTAVRRMNRELDTSDARLTAALDDAEIARLKDHLRVLLAEDPALQVDSLSNRVGYLVTHAHQQLRERAQRHMSEIELHPRDFGLLSTIRRDEPCSQSHLAEVLGVSDPAILPALDALEARGLLTRERNADDRRFSDVRLTALGRLTLKAADKHAAELQSDLLERLGAKADDDLRALLARIVS
jgi:DNA-binding MarR family transcriptional regulator